MNTKTISHNLAIIALTAAFGFIVRTLHLEFSSDQLNQIAQVVAPFVTAIAVAVYNLVFTEGGVKAVKAAEKQGGAE